MRRLPVPTAIVACAALLAPIGVAEAAKKPAKPSIKRVTPMRVTVGKKITIRGVNFSSSRKRNTVLFSSGKRSAFAKPSRASRKKLVVTIPASVENLLGASAATRKPSRLKLRVVTKSYGKVSTKRVSPIVVSAVRKGKSAACGKGADWDGDLLPNTTELKYALDPCKQDTDGDASVDGWEYWAARDLNLRAVPYPGKKPYPNPLDASDGRYDFDGDSLSATDEHRAWVTSGKNFDPSRPANQSPLGYSDGTQRSYPGEPTPVPEWKSGSYGIGFAPPAYPAVLDRDRDGVLTDDERDADRDGLNNFVETTGPGKASWWGAYLGRAEVEPWPGEDPDANYSYFGEFSQRPFADVDLADPDVDGDGLLDGEDDQDNDDWTNIDEMYNPGFINTPAGSRRTNAFNPCAPDTRSRTCPRYFPL